jgi:hypothetical protein
MTTIKYELWRANLRRTMQSERGQAFLQEFLEALDALPRKRLIQGACMGCRAIRQKTTYISGSIAPTQINDQGREILELAVLTVSG